MVARSRVALLAAGPDADASPFTQLGEGLLAVDEPWRLRLLVPRAGSIRLELKRELDRIAGDADDVLVVIAGTAVATPTGPALVTAPEYRDYPEDALLPLADLGARVRALRAARAAVVVAVDGAVDAAACLDALAGDLGGALVVVDTGDRRGALDALIAALRGAALDAATGAVTLASLGAHLAAARPAAALQRADDAAPFTTTPPLARLWHHAAAVGAPARELVGTILPGRFRVDAEIARGSFGTVYRGRQLAVDRAVAIKVMPAGVDFTTGDGQLFVQEIQAAGRIDHPNVVSIYQADVTPDGRLFFAMELLDGVTLQDVIAHGPIPAARAIALVSQLLAGLGAAHQAGLVHADVKPANAIVVPDGTGERVVLVDFGLARLRPGGGPAEAAGGTPAFMAPEQLRDGRVDARSDLFAAALVLVALLTGWRRRRASELVPPLDDVDDPRLRDVLGRALALDPAERFATAAELVAALTGESIGAGVVALRPPFHGFAPFDEADRDRLHGRDREIQLLLEHVLFGRLVVLTAPSGTGKTSLLRAGLVPRLEDVGARPIYASCRTAPVDTIRAGLARAADAGDRRVVVIVDQLEELLVDEPPDLTHLFAALDAAPDAVVVLSVREELLARLLAAGQGRLDGTAPFVRLGPLTRAGARDAIVRPLAERRVTVEPALVDALLDDLARPDGLVHPQPLQLACTILFESLDPGDAHLSLDHYRGLGGFDAIVGDHLDRVLDTQLDARAADVARDLFLALVTAAHTRASRTEAELLDELGGHDAATVRGVLEALRAQGLLARQRTPRDEVAWELVHDSLVARVLGWIDRHDLARRRAVELVRYHLRRSRPDTPSLLTAAELRELEPHADALRELERAWAARPGVGPWTPATLVARSRRIARRRVAAGIALALTLTAIVGAAIHDRWRGAVRRRHEQSLQDRDLGRFVVELTAFDRDADGGEVIVPAAELPALAWALHDPDPHDASQPGAPVPASRFAIRTTEVSDDGRARRFFVEARGGAAFLVVTGRGRAGEACPPSVVPVRRVPGYAQRKAQPIVRVLVPTCAATLADTVEIPAGPFIAGGVGEPPSHMRAAYPALAREETIDLPAFRIDRFEVTNRAYAAFAGMAELTGIAAPIYAAATELAHSDQPWAPVTSVTWRDATTYCRYMGKHLPSTEQWTKALRGGLLLPDGSPNPAPRRNLPWRDGITAGRASLLADAPQVAAPGAFPLDRSEYGVMDLAGNVQEWTSSLGDRGAVVTRGGNWAWTPPELLVDFIAIDNPRSPNATDYTVGIRCALDASSGSAAVAGASPGGSSISTSGPPGLNPSPSK